MIDLSTWRQAWSLLSRAERRRALGVFAIIILAALSSAVMVVSIFPFLAVLSDPERIHTTAAFQWAYVTFGFGGDYAFLVALGLFSLVTIVASNVIQMVKTYAVTRFTLMQTHSLSLQLLDVYLRQPYEYFLDTHTGDMGKAILTESTHIVTHFFRPLADLAAALLSTLAILAVVVWVDPVIAIVALGLLGSVYAVILAATRGRLRRLGDERVRANSGRFRVSGEALGGIKDIKILGREAAYLDRYAEPSLKMAQVQVVSNVIAGLPPFVVQSVAFGGVILLCLVMVDAATYESGGSLGVMLPLIGVFAFAGQRILPELSKIYGAYSKLQFGVSVVRAINRDLALGDGRPALPAVPPPGLGLKQGLELDAIAYAYPNASDRGLHDLSLSIRAGERIGIVGPTGAGKTTLADIVLGLLEPQGGAMRVDGVAVTAENRRAWQQSVGYVPQDIFLIDASVAQNIALGLTPAQIDRARLERAARLAQLHDFITTDLPEGYDTFVGERGVRLSGGQRQRIGIARALYHDADLIVFDEATSALDNATERDVMSAIADLPGEKTVLMIAHRMSTVRRCDRIAVLDRGRLIGFDAWDALIETNPVFAGLVNGASADTAAPAADPTAKD